MSTKSAKAAKAEKKNKNREHAIPTTAVPTVPDELLKILFLTQYELKAFLYKTLTEYGYAPVWADGYLYAQGNIPVMLLSHMDTVHKEPVREFYVSNNGNITSPQGIGGDDRCGVYALYTAIVKSSVTGSRPYILFTEDEEIGGIGASKFVSDLYAYSDIDVNFLIELDRKGSKDSVYYECDNVDFEVFINNYGFESDYGSFSDISVVAPALGVAAVNLSCGYYNAHTTKEIINLYDLNNSIAKLDRIIDDTASGNTVKYEYIEAVYYSSKTKKYSPAWYFEDDDYYTYDSPVSDRSHGFGPNDYDEEITYIGKNIIVGDYQFKPIDFETVRPLDSFRDILQIGDSVYTEYGDNVYFVNHQGEVFIYAPIIEGLIKSEEAIAYGWEGQLSYLTVEDCETGSAVDFTVYVREPFDTEDSENEKGE